MCHDLRHISGDNTTSATDNALCWGARGKKKKRYPAKILLCSTRCPQTARSLNQTEGSTIEPERVEGEALL